MSIVHQVEVGRVTEGLPKRRVHAFFVFWSNFGPVTTAPASTALLQVQTLQANKNYLAYM